MACGRLALLAVAALFGGSAYGQASSVEAFQSLVVCLPPSAASGLVAANVANHPVSCGTDSSGNALNAYVERWQLVPASGSGSGFSAVDPGQTAAFWAGAFGSVLLLFFTGAGIGAVLDVIRRG